MRIEAQSWPKMPVTETSAAPIRSASRIASVTYTAPNTPPSHTHDGAPQSAGPGDGRVENSVVATMAARPTTIETANTIFAAHTAPPGTLLRQALAAIRPAMPAPAGAIRRTEPI